MAQEVVLSGLASSEAGPYSTDRFPALPTRFGGIAIVQGVSGITGISSHDESSKIFSEAVSQGIVASTPFSEMSIVIKNINDALGKARGAYTEKSIVVRDWLS